MQQNNQLTSAQKALNRLMQGNERYVNGKTNGGAGWDESRRKSLLEGQSPLASVLTCSDSRVPPEHIFDAGLGELFVCRNAGNIPDELTIGSLEYAVAHTNCPLVMVLGHSSCGAMTATIEAFNHLDIHESPYVDHVIRRLLPSALATQHDNDSKDRWVLESARRHVKDACHHILRSSSLISSAVNQGKTGLVGAFYHLDSGLVEITIPL